VGRLKTNKNQTKDTVQSELVKNNFACGSHWTPQGGKTSKYDQTGFSNKKSIEFKLIPWSCAAWMSGFLVRLLRLPIKLGWSAMKFSGGEKLGEGEQNQYFHLLWCPSQGA